MDVYLEVGSKRVFAGAPGWPGWCRSGRGEEGALAALVEFAPRYAAVLDAAGVRPAFKAPPRLGSLRVVERFPGDATTDFGAPSIAPASDGAPVKPADLRTLLAIMNASWSALELAARTAGDAELAKGPRGGGRSLGAILEHVAAAEASYAGKIAVRMSAVPNQIQARRAALLDGLAEAVTVGLPATGPRGGAMWSPRYLVRRAAWHVLDHAWEIEDRSKGDT